MTQEFDVVVERDAEGFFVATVPALPGCHTQARSLDELMVRVKEAIELCLGVQGTLLPCDGQALRNFRSGRNSRRSFSSNAQSCVSLTPSKAIS
jgi:predicted RNase H-like HicB family nuclease